jgi:hypothetical protein
MKIVAIALASTILVTVTGTSSAQEREFVPPDRELGTDEDGDR